MTFSPYHDGLTTVLICIALFLVAFGLDQIPRGGAYAVGADRCVVDVFDRQVACIGVRQDYGFPFTRGSNLTELRPADGQSYVPKSEYVCRSGCHSNGGRQVLSANFALVFGLAFVYFAAKNFLFDRWLDRKLIQQWEEDNKHNPTGPGKGW